MSGFRFTPQAVEDLFEIWSYIAGDDLDAADRVENAILTACTFLSANPLSGSVREDLTALPVASGSYSPFGIIGWSTVGQQCRFKLSESFMVRGT